MIAVFGALPAELQGLVRRLEGVRSERVAGLSVLLGRIAGRETALVLTGVGRARAARAAAAARDALAPEEALSIGYAGGLRADLPMGTLVAATHVLSISGDPHDLAAGEAPPAARAELAEEGAGRLGRIAARLPAAGFRSGGMLTVDWAVGAPEAKARLGARTGALCVEMETYEIASAFAGRARVSALRMVTDSASDPLPEALRAPPKREGRDLLRLSGAAARGPAAFARFARLSMLAARRYRLMDDLIARYVAEG